MTRTQRHFSIQFYLPLPCASMDFDGDQIARLSYILLI